MLNTTVKHRDLSAMRASGILHVNNATIARDLWLSVIYRHGVTPVQTTALEAFEDFAVPAVSAPVLPRHSFTLKKSA
ncbi:hypothetical protein ACYPKM_02535 [Pseudomonas aeruginosa]